MKTGDRIKNIRTLRGMTQKELGLAVGFPARSADVRIAQYENGTRTPKEDVVQLMAQVLKVKPSAITSHNNDIYIDLMYTLFDLENTFGLHIDQIEGELCLRMDRTHKDYVRIFEMMLAWYEKRKLAGISFDDANAYEEWKLNYPPVLDRSKGK